MENQTHFGSWDTAILLQIASHPLSCNEKEKKKLQKIVTKKNDRTNCGIEKGELKAKLIRGTQKIYKMKIFKNV